MQIWKQTSESHMAINSTAIPGYRQAQTLKAKKRNGWARLSQSGGKTGLNLDKLQSRWPQLPSEIEQLGAAECWLVWHLSKLIYSTAGCSFGFCRLSCCGSAV
ncbi:hypothetical protein BaRGS_00015138 [Batillaria attramentaria]|uniref:Uncharacterized protein n=1 Tax=Batillaria attramentaria TaxID=370345 RepID=A0ABD0L306_9CAEN